MKNIYVIGGGIVGVSCALNLQEKGFNVTLIDKKDFGCETSFGNAGVITRGSIIPFNNPKLYSSLPKYLSNKHAAVRYDMAYLLKNPGWVTKFILHATESRAFETASKLNTLIKHSLNEHKKWLQQADLLQKLRENGWLKLYRSINSFENSAYERFILDTHEVGYQLLNRNEITALEPALKPIFERGMLVTDAASVDNPGEVVQGYAKLFIERGGKVWRVRVNSLVRSASGFSLNTDDETRQADEVVLALGPWSNDLLKGLGPAFPLCFERGYHQHYAADPSLPLTRPICDVEGSFVITPTNLGLRLTSGSELKERDAIHTPDQLQQILPRAREAIKLGEPSSDLPWCGSRPSLPDSLPVIGPMPGVAGLWLAFGHQHIGFSTGPATGRLIAELVSGETPFVNPEPFAASRFRKNP